jgi:hypothetical protein
MRSTDCYVQSSIFVRPFFSADGSAADSCEPLGNHYRTVRGLARIPIPGRLDEQLAGYLMETAEQFDQ